MTLMQQIRTWCCTTVEGWSRWCGVDSAPLCNVPPNIT